MPTNLSQATLPPDLPPPYELGQLPPTQGALGIGTAIGAGARNQTVSGLLAQLLGPSLQGLYEAGPVSQAASQYRASRQSNLSGMAGRGLLDTGANPSAQRGLEQLYSQSVLNAVTGASQAESNRRQSLLSSLLGVSQSDLSFIQSLNRGALGQQAADANQSIADLQKVKYLSVGGATIAATLAGGIAGGAGGLGASASSTAGTGQFANVIGGSSSTAAAGGGLGGALSGAGQFNQIGQQIQGPGQQAPGLIGFGGYSAPQYSLQAPGGAGGGVSGPSTQSLISNLGLTLAERF